MSRETFESLVAPGARLDLLRAVAWLSKDEHPGLDVDALVGTLDAIARPLRRAALATASALEQAEELRVLVYVTLAFAGNEEDYYDPRNSVLSDVLERKTGIPISLALVYCELAKRLGVRARGVAFPGHFLVRIDGDAEPVFVDPFFGGRVQSARDLEKLLARVAGQANLEDKHPSVTSAMLEAAAPRAILVRWLMNLRGAHLQRGDFARALVALDRLVSVVPGDATALRDRGLLAAKLGATRQATADLERAIELSGDGSVARQARVELAKIARTSSPLN